MALYLSNQTVMELIDGIVNADMCTAEVRDLLLAGVNKRYRASLPKKESPLCQIQSDLSMMNSISFLTNGEVPLRIWLANATQWLKASGHAQQALFQQVLDGVVTESEHRIEEGTKTGQMDPSLPVAIGAFQEDYRTMLEEFLVPFEGILRFTRSIFDMLREGLLDYLEYHPGKLQNIFASLPAGDPRKDLWMGYIDKLQTRNRQAVELIDRFYGRIVLDEFRDKCDKYLLHAEVWELAWERLTGRGSIPATPAESDRLWAPPFPDGLDKALAAEIAEVRYRAGQ